MSIEAPSCNIACPKCSRAVRNGSEVHLWDGKDYCRECVAMASPNLLALAERFPVLVEGITANPAEAVRDELRGFCIAGPLFTALLVYVGVTNGQGVVAALFVSALCIVPAALLKCWGAHRNAAAVRGRVEIQNGKLTVWHPTGNLTRALDACRWHVGKPREASYFFCHLQLRRKVVIIGYPLVSIRFLGTHYERVPCGLTDEMRDVWEAFLTLAGIERTRKWWWRSTKKLSRSDATPRPSSVEQRPR